MSNEPLQEAYRLIREGRKQEATQILLPIVRAEPLNADAWWLLANAVENRDQRRGALEQVLKLRPDDARAQRAYESLRAAEPAPKRKTDGDFSDDAPAMPRKRKSSGANPVTLILAVIGLIAVISCGLCVVAAAVSFPAIGRVFQQIAVVTFIPNFGTPASTSVPPTLSADVNPRGTIDFGETRQGAVSSFTDDSWTFRANAGMNVVIELNAANARSLDPQLYLYDSDRRWIAENDDIDIDTDHNSRIELTLPYTGMYTIVVSAFGSVRSGNYELTLRQR